MIGGNERTARVMDDQTEGGVPVGDWCFYIYIFFLLEFFLKFSVRFPAVGSIRPTLLSVGILGLLLFSQRAKIARRFSNAVSRRLLTLLLFLVLSLPFVSWPGSAIDNAGDYFKAIVFFFFTVSVVDTEKRLIVFIWVFVGCQVFRALEPLYLHITEGYWGSSTYIGGGEFAGRLQGAPADVANPNELGFVIVTAVPFLYYLLWPSGWKGKLALIAVLPCLFYALMLTMSRGAFLALLVVFFFILRESNKRGFLLLVGAVACVAMWSVMSPMQKDRYLSLISDDTVGAKTREGRLKGMVAEFELGLERPVFGHGLGTTAEAKYRLTGRTKAAHNFYAELMIEIGAVGAIIFIRYISGIYMMLQNLHQRWGGAVPHFDFRLRLYHALLAVFWMYIVYSFNYWGLSQYYWYLLGGLVVVFARLSPSPSAKGGATLF